MNNHVLYTFMYTCVDMYSVYRIIRVCNCACTNKHTVCGSGISCFGIFQISVRLMTSEENAKATCEVGATRHSRLSCETLCDPLRIVS